MNILNHKNVSTRPNLPPSASDSCVTLSKRLEFSNLSLVKEKKNSTALARLSGGFCESMYGAWRMAGLSSVNDRFIPCPVPLRFPSLEKFLLVYHLCFIVKNGICSEFSIWGNLRILERISILLINNLYIKMSILLKLFFVPFSFDITKGIARRLNEILK